MFLTHGVNQAKSKTAHNWSESAMSLHYFTQHSHNQSDAQWIVKLSCFTVFQHVEDGQGFLIIFQSQ